MAENAKQEVRIDDNYSILADVTGYVLVRYGIGHRAKTGEEFISRQDVGYFYTISDACRGYVREIERDAVLNGAVASERDFLDILSRKEESLRIAVFKHASHAFESKEGSAA